MKLYEFQGGRIFSEYGIPVPNSRLILPGDNLDSFSPPLVLKSQVLAGGRGKAGGIKAWDGSVDLKNIVLELFHLKINNEPVKAILASENIKINREMYISLTFNRSKSTPVIIAGVSGGVDIENTAQKEADKIFFSEFNSLLGISDFQIRQLSKHLKIENYLDFKNIILAMYHIFKDYDASLVEINPLAMTSEELIAIDSKIDLDEQAAFRHPNLYQQLKEETMPIIGDELQMKTEGDTITFVPLSGNIGLVSDGAGTGLLAMDLLSRYGGTVASFCELGGITSPEVVHKALKQVHQDPNVKSILVVLIGGFNRMDEMAEGIVRFYQETKDNDRTPIYIRMCGTKEEEGKKLMLDAQIPIDNSLHEAVKKAIKKATEN